MSETQSNNAPEQKKGWYEKSYKLLLIIPVVMLLGSIIFLAQFTAENGDIVYKDVSLTGGTTITVLDKTADSEQIKEQLKTEFPDIIVRKISDFGSGEQQAFFVESAADVETLRDSLESVLGYELTAENASIEFSGASLSQGFYQQLRTAIIIAFVFMAIVVFIIFRTPVPSLAVIISAFADIVFTIVLIDILGFQLSVGGIVALLMLIGYSVDTDILLTTRILRKKEGSLNQRMFDSLKTGLTMTITSIIALAVALTIIYSFSDTLRQIFSILLIGLGFDILNTWITNASILRWYAEAKNIQ